MDPFEQSNVKKEACDVDETEQIDLTENIKAEDGEECLHNSLYQLKKEMGYIKAENIFENKKDHVQYLNGTIAHDVNNLYFIKEETICMCKSDEDMACESSSLSQDRKNVEDVIKLECVCDREEEMFCRKDSLSQDRKPVDHIKVETTYDRDEEIKCLRSAIESKDNLDFRIFTKTSLQAIGMVPDGLPVVGVNLTSNDSMASGLTLGESSKTLSNVSGHQAECSAAGHDSCTSDRGVPLCHSTNSLVRMLLEKTPESKPRPEHRVPLSNSTSSLARTLLEKTPGSNPAFEHSQCEPDSRTSAKSNMLFQCRFCPASFKNKSGFHMHKKVHLELEEKRPIKCGLCSASYNSQNNFLKHKNVHFGDSLLYCKICSISFKFRNQGIRHRQDHMDGVIYDEKKLKSEENYQCNKCTASFQTKLLYDRHTKTHYRKSLNLVKYLH